MQRRVFLKYATITAPAILRGATLSHKERIDRALAGKELDRPPFSFWHHFGLKTPDQHAERTLQFHRAHRTDLVKVMSDFPYPKPQGAWHELKPLDNPFPEQIRALELIRDGLAGRAYFVETLFNPWNVAEKLSSPAEVQRLKKEQPRQLMSALSAIAESEIRHARLAMKTGASGVFLSVANANPKVLSPEEYETFSRPYDKRILDAVSGAKLNVLHLHNAGQGYMQYFREFKAPVINHSVHATGVPLRELRTWYKGVLAGGIDETRYRTMSPDELKKQWIAAAADAGSRFLLTPGCSVPDESTPAELAKLPSMLGA